MVVAQMNHNNTITLRELIVNPKRKNHMTFLNKMAFGLIMLVLIFPSWSKEIVNKLTKISSNTSEPNGHVSTEWIKANCGDYQYETISNQEIKVTGFQGITITKRAIQKNENHYVTYHGGFSTNEPNLVSFHDSKYNFLFNGERYKDLLKLSPAIRRNDYFPYSKPVEFKTYNPENKKMYETKLLCPSDIKLDMSNMPRVEGTGEMVYLSRNASIIYNPDSRAKAGTLVLVNSYGEGIWTTMDDLQNTEAQDRYTSYIYLPKSMDGNIEFPIGFWDHIRPNGFVYITIFRVNYDFIKSSLPREQNHLVRCGCGTTISARIIN